MASVLDPEVQLAQKLASNEKPVRTKAIKKLRKYINVRSQKATDGFTADELLKLWKGLFYCLWMQDKPLLQEDLSKQISTLIHSFNRIDAQFLYIESFLQTFKREWTGIDGLRMDKFFQLVRFMFKQTFEMLKRKNWESSLVARFLELLTSQLLQGGSAAPSGLQFHILDLYMTELAAVGSSELTADQNLMLIEPFCKTAAKTKDRTLFRAICNSIFSCIIDQAPFAIEELMQEMKAAEECDSGQASEGDDKDQIEVKMGKPLSNKQNRIKINGSKSNHEEEVDDELLDSEALDTELPCDGDIGPVLQFDYTALADKLFELASRSSTPSQNRQRLYKIINVLRDLGEGIFPQDEYPEEVSTDEDDEMFGSRKRMKRGCHPMDEEKGTPAAKKRKKKQASTPDKQKNDSEKLDSERLDQTTHDAGKKSKRKKKVKRGGSILSEGNTVNSKQVQAIAQCEIQEIEKAEENPHCAQPEDLQKEAMLESHISTEKVIKATTTQSEMLRLLKKHPSVTEEAAQPRSCANHNNEIETFSQKVETSESKPQTVAFEDQQTFDTEISPEAVVPVLGKKKKKKKTGPETKEIKADCKPVGESQISNGISEAKINLKRTSEATTLAKKRSKKSLNINAQVEVEDEHAHTDIRSEARQHTTSVVIKRKTKVKAKQKIEPKLVTSLAKKKQSPKMAPIQTSELKDETPLQVVSSQDLELPLAETEAVSSKRKLIKNKKRKIPVVFEFEADQLGPAAQEATMIKTEEETSAKSKLVNKSQTSESKKVTFGLNNNKTAEFRKTDRSLLVSPDGSSRVPFDPKQKPKSGVLKSPPTPGSTKLKKIPKVNKKKSLNILRTTPKRRPLAADFF